jgi:hypothetical protein
LIESIDFPLKFTRMSMIDFKSDATLYCNREIILDRIVDNLGQVQKLHRQLLKDIRLCFSIDLIDENHIHFPPDRSKSVLHFIVRGLLRINLQSVESRLKYYGDPFTQTKVGNLIKAASGTSGFDKCPPDICSNSHPCFNKSTAEGKHASQLYGALEVLRRSIRRKANLKMKMISMTADKISISSSSSSNQLSTVLGKRSSSPMESLINAAASLEEKLDKSPKENGTRDLREDLDATETESVEMARGSINVC